MIIGLGTDIQELNHIARMMDLPHYNADKVFDKKEQEYCNSKYVPIRHYAGFWAAKEAWMKASGQTNVDMSTIQIRHGDDGKPFISEPNWMYTMHKKVYVSISHSGSYATATVIIEEV